MHTYKRAIYLLVQNELGQVTSAELRSELAGLSTQMKADPESQPPSADTEETPEAAPAPRAY